MNIQNENARAGVSFGSVTLSVMKRIEDPAAERGHRTEWTPTVEPLRAALLGVRNGRWKKELDALRGIEDPQARSRAKRFRLPRIDVAGVYATGAKEHEIISWSGFFCLDVDAKDNPGLDADALFRALAALPWTAAVFRSASGNGLKAVLAGDVASSAGLAEAFAAAERFLKKIFPALKIDAHTAAIRHTYASYDPDAYVAPDFSRLRACDGRLEWRDDERVPHAPPLSALLDVYAPLTARVWNCGSEYVEHLPAEHEYARRTETQLWRIFLAAGFPKCRKDELLLHVAQARHLSRIESARCGYREGVYEKDGVRFAVCGSPKWIEPVPGAWENIRAVLAARFDDPDDPRQLSVLFAWLARARKRIRAALDAHSEGVPAPRFACPLISIMGEQAVGKSALFSDVFLPLLGGRAYDAKKVLALGERFNGGVAEKEVLVIDDIPAKAVTLASRAGFAENIKAYLYSASVSIESKFRDEQQLDDHCLVAIQLFNPDSILSTPDYSKVRDKAIFLNCARFRELEEESEKDFAELSARIRAELPAFAHFLDKEFVPDASVAPDPASPAQRRNGMICYCNAEVENLLLENDKASLLLAQYDEYARSATSAVYGVKLTASAIGEKAGVRASPEQLGQWLHQCAEADASRVVPAKDRSGRVRGWVINEPR